MAWIWRLVRQSVSEWLGDGAMSQAAAVAFYSILSIAPLFVLAVAIAGAVFGEEAARTEILAQTKSLIGGAGAEVVQTALENANKPREGMLAAAIGIVTLLIGASGVFGQLQQAMNVIWNVDEDKHSGFWGWIRTKIFSFGMVLSVGFLLLISLILTTTISMLATHAGDLLPGGAAMVGTLAGIANLIMVASLFALIFRYLPDVRTPWQDIWVGAFVTAILFTVGKWGIGMYLATAAVGSPFGAAGSLVTLIVWIYYSALIVFLGAEITQVRARMRRGEEPKGERKPDRESPQPAGVPA